jgi:DNA-binding response OmpR family regulator
VKILIADDSATPRLLLKRELERLGHECLVAEDGLQAWEAFQGSGVDAVISDWMMPGLDGDELCRRVRADPNAPYAYFVLLTSLDDKRHIVAGMEAGADDYLTKPFAFAEVVARLHALQRRHVVAQKPVLERAGVCLDPARHEVTRDGRSVTLSPKEFGVLHVLLRAEGAVVSPETLLERVWDEHVDPFTNTVRVTVMNLRRKLGTPAVIETVIGTGYRLG